jgi:hypothetical protein
MAQEWRGAQEVLRRPRAGFCLDLVAHCEDSLVELRPEKQALLLLVGRAFMVASMQIYAGLVSRDIEPCVAIATGNRLEPLKVALR